MIIRELWTEEDDARVVAARHALESGDLAGALFAVEGANERRSDEARRRLERWAERVEDRLSVPGTTGIEALRRVLVGELHISGDVDDYYNPRNSALSMVVNVRAGLPILVSAVWILVGRLARIDVVGIALPGHFIVRVGGDDGDLIDAFRYGRTLTEIQCRELVERAGSDVEFNAAMLRPVDDAALVERVLRNLVRVHQRGDEREAVFRASRMLAAIRPDSAEHTLAFAKLCEEIGDHSLADSTYRDVAARFNGSADAVRAAEKLAARATSTRFVN